MKASVPTISRLSIQKAVESVLESGARSATVFQHPKLIARATLQFKLDKRNSRTTILLTVGSPNYRERAFVKEALKAGEPFPIRNVQLRWWQKNKRK